MGIQYDEGKRMFKLDTACTTYMIGISDEGYIMGSGFTGLGENI